MALSVTTSTPSASSSLSSDESQAPRSPVSPASTFPAAAGHMPTPSQALTSAPKAKANSKSSPSLNKNLGNKANKPNPAEEAPAATSTSNVAVAPAKRKPSRRANTAERRATHNMVERQRRETLNGRFLDLSHLLPNLSQIRRPSKSSIVNSSIAHIHASRRHRLLASRVALALTAENDALIEETEALKRELNEWRDRAGLPRVTLRGKDQPPSAARGEGYRTIVGGELEVVMAVGGEEGGDEDEDSDNKYGGYGVSGDVEMDETPDSPQDSERGDTMMAGTNPFAHTVPTPPASSGRPASAVSTASRRHSVSQNGPPSARESRRGSTLGSTISSMSVDNGMITVPTAGLVFENPAMGMAMNNNGLNGPMYDHQFSSVSPQIPGAPFDKFSALYGSDTESNMLNGQRSLFTPPASSHGLTDRQERQRKERGGGRDREREQQAYLYMQQQRQRQHQPVHQNQQHHNSNAMMHHYAQAQAQAMMLQQATRNQRDNGSHHFTCRSPDGDDCSSVGSCHSGSGGARARSGSNSGSAYGSSYGSPTDERWGNNDLIVSPVDGGRYDARGRYDVGYDLPLGINIPLGLNGLGMGGMGMGMVDIDHDFSSPEYENPLSSDEFEVPRRPTLRM